MDSKKSSEDGKRVLKYHELKSIDSKLLERIDRFIIYADDNGTEGGIEVFLITQTDDVYAFGVNKKGRLGFGHNEKVKEAKLIPELCGMKVIDIRSGSEFSVALTQPGIIYTFGYSLFGRTGNGLTDEYHKPKVIPVDNQSIFAINCTNFRTFMITQTGQLYCFGQREDLSNRSSVSIPTKVVIPSEMKIKSISCGFDHILVLTDTGKALSWGNNEDGQLGLGPGLFFDSHTDIPQVIDINERIKQVFCGYYHSLCLTIDGKIYSMGSNGFGQLGVSSDFEKIESTPQLVLSEQKKICCHRNISMSLDVNNKLHVWGQLKNAYSIVCFPVPSEHSSFQEVVNTFADGYRNYRYTLKPLSSVHLFEKKSVSHLNKIMDRVFNNSEYSDLKFKVKCNGSKTQFKIIYCHKCIIKESNDYFRTMFCNDWKENKTNEIEITGHSFEAYHQYIKSLYTDSINCENIEVLLEILSITERYLDFDKKDKCEEQIKRVMNSENVCSVFSTAIKYKSESLKQMAFEMMSDSIEKMRESTDFKNLDPISSEEFQKLLRIDN